MMVDSALGELWVQEFRELGFRVSGALEWSDSGAGKRSKTSYMQP